MPRFFFHVHGAFGSTPDEQGRELRDLEIARREAVRGVRSLLSADLMQGRLDVRGRIEVTDEGGDVVLAIPFSETLDIHHE